MDPGTKRALNVGSSLGMVGWGLVSIVTGDVVGGSLLLGSEAILWSVNPDAQQAVREESSNPPKVSAGEPNVINEYIPPHKRGEQ
jgi:hypothetical protein